MTITLTLNEEQIKMINEINMRNVSSQDEKVEKIFTYGLENLSYRRERNKKEYQLGKELKEAYKAGKITL